MLHNDRSKSMINNHQRHDDDKPHAHPIDRLLIGYQKNRPSSMNFYRTETNHLLQRQRVIRSFLHKIDENEPSIRKPMTLSATPKNLFISSIVSPPINNNRQQISPVLTRRLKIEHITPSHSISSANDLPSNFTFRPRVTHRSSSLKLMKKITESPHKSPLLPSISIPRLSEQDSIHSRTLTSALYAKSRLLKQWRKHRYSSSFNRLNNFDQTNDIEQLSINPRVMNNLHHEDSMKHSKPQMKVLSDDGKDSDLLSDENSSTSTCHSQLTPPNSSETDLLSSSSSSSKNTPKNRVYSRRRIYNHALPPVTEDFDDEETESLNDMKKKLVENYAIRPQKKEKRIHHLVDEDETSLTFDILNQEETKFEKQLFKSRRFH